MILEIGDQVRALLEERHILEDDVRQVVEHAETTGEKLYQQGSDLCLGKKTIENASFYVVYRCTAQSCQVQTAYVHRAEIL